MEIPKMNDEPKIDDTEINELRDELLFLAKRGKIKQSEKTVKGAKLPQLERIKREYVREQTEIVDEHITKHIIDDMVKRDLVGVSSLITSNIKYIRLATLVVVAGGYALKTYQKNKSARKEEEENGKQTNEQNPEQQQ